MPCFVAGQENRLAVVAVNRLLGQPTHQENDCKETHRAATNAPFNPLVLIGPTGSGKTHLARGVANRLREQLPSGSVAYLSVAEFGRHYQQAREQDQLDQLRTSLRNLRLLVLEDFHLLRPRAVVQYELRETVDALLASDAIVLITTQQSLTTIPSLEPSLRDRLASGLTVSLRPPSEAARLDILQLAAAARGADLDVERARRLSQQIDGPVPRLFRAIAELEPSIATQHRATEQSPSMRQIVAVVARYFSLSQTLLRGPSRRRSTVYARSVAVYLARTLTNLSYAQIGSDLGRRDHTTTMHADRRLREQLTTDPATQETVEDLKRILTAD